MAGRLAVHRAQHRDLRRRPIDPELPSRPARTCRRSAVAARQAPGRPTPRPEPAVRSGPGRRARTRGPGSATIAGAWSAGMLCRPADAVIRPAAPSEPDHSPRRRPSAPRCSSSQRVAERRRDPLGLAPRQQRVDQRVRVRAATPTATPGCRAPRRPRAAAATSRAQGCAGRSLCRRAPSGAPRRHVVAAARALRHR